MFARAAIGSSARRFATTAAGQQNLQRESTFMRVWAKEKAAYPIILITLFAAGMMVVKGAHALTNPELSFKKDERKSLDYVENHKPLSGAERYANTTFHRGPEFIRERSPYKISKSTCPEDRL